MHLKQQISHWSYFIPNCFHFSSAYFFLIALKYFPGSYPTLSSSSSGYSVSSVTQSCPTLCNPMNRSTPGLPVPHKLPEFTQTHIHRVSDAIQPSNPLSSPSPPAPWLLVCQFFWLSLLELFFSSCVINLIESLFFLPHHLPMPRSFLVFFLIPGKPGPPEKAMAPHSNTLAWKIPWTEEPGRLQSMGL